MYRPENWENDFGEGFPEHDAFEAGASAMLEALKGGESFRCSIGGVDSVQGGSTMEPQNFVIYAQSIVEDKDDHTLISLPHFNPLEYPKRKGWLVFITEDDEP